MRRVFGEAPWIVTGKDTALLQGMAGAYGGHDDNPYQDLLNIIDANPEGVEMWPEW